MGFAERTGVKATSFFANTDLKTLAFSGQVEIGDLLIVTGSLWANPQNTSVAVTDNLSTPTDYTGKILWYADTVNGTRSTFIAFGTAVAQGTPTVTIDPNGVNSYGGVTVTAFTGAHATELDVNGTWANGSTTTPTRDITTVAAGALIIGVASNTGLSNFTENYTLIGENYSSVGHNVQYRIVGAGGTYTMSWSVASGTWTVQVASFAPAVVAGGAIGILGGGVGTITIGGVE